MRRQRRARWVAFALFAGSATSIGAFLHRFGPPSIRVPQLSALLPAPGWLRIERVDIEGVPPSAEALIRDALGPVAGRAWGPFASRSATERLNSRLGFLSSASVRWNCLSRSLRIEARLQQPVARLLRGGRACGWLGSTGRAFDPPPGVYDRPPDPVLELGDLPQAELGAVSGWVVSLERAFEAGWSQGAYQSKSDGWQLRLSDGSRVLWGSLDWTEQKIERLQQVLADAGRRFGSELTVDLRYFEDGRILVRPTERQRPGRAVPMPHRGLRG